MTANLHIFFHSTYFFAQNLILNCKIRRITDEEKTFDMRVRMKIANYYGNKDQTAAMEKENKAKWQCKIGRIMRQNRLFNLQNRQFHDTKKPTS